jgi:hypothetical protein
MVLQVWFLMLAGGLAIPGSRYLRGGSRGVAPYRRLVHPLFSLWGMFWPKLSASLGLPGRVGIVLGPRHHSHLQLRRRRTRFVDGCRGVAVQIQFLNHLDIARRISEGPVGRSAWWLLVSGPSKVLTARLGGKTA